MKDAFGNNVEFASFDKVYEHPAEVHRLMQFVFRHESPLVGVSDLTQLADFVFLTAADLERISKLLGFAVTMDDYIYEIVRKMRAA